MKLWQIICLIGLLLIIVFNPKIQLTRIFVEQFKVYKNDKTHKISMFDILSFLIAPICISILTSVSLPYEKVATSAGTIMTVFSIVATLLLSFLALLVDLSLIHICSSYGNSAGLVARIATFEEDTGLKLTLENFLDHYRLDPRSIYKFASFSRLCARADIIDNFEEPIEEVMSKALSRFALVDSRRWIVFMLRVLENIDHFDLTRLSDIEKRMLQMSYITMWGKTIEDWNADEVFENFKILSNSPIMLSELIALLKYNYNRIDFIDEPVSLGFDCPLDLHCTYTRDQLLVAMDFMKPSTVREGVKWLPDKKIDVFFITLNKSNKDYSPTTMYQDYSINETLFHWQSQSTTNAESKDGQRYINHRKNDSKVLLFVREFKNDVYGNTAPYTYLGTANYVSHNGSRPMNITWRLDAPIPAKYLKKTNKLVVG